MALREIDMLAYRVPGVYFEWLDSRLRDIDAVRTDIAAFIGIAARGPVGAPVKIESWSQFTSTFGAHIPNGFLAYAVEGFFTNGGQTCWIVRVVDPDPAKTKRGSADLLAAGKPALTLGARSLGSWSSEMNISILRNGEDRFTLTLRLTDGSQESWRNLSMQPPSIDLLDSEEKQTLRLAVMDPTLWDEEVTVLVELVGAGNFSLTVVAPQGRQEKWSNLNTASAVSVLNNSKIVRARDLKSPSVNKLPDPLASNLKNGFGVLKADSRFVGTMLSDGTLDKDQTGSRLAFVSNIPDPAGFPENTPDPTLGTNMRNGSDGLASLKPDHFINALAALERIEEIGIVAMPDMMPKPFALPVRRRTTRHCERNEVFAPDPEPVLPEFPQDFGETGVSLLQQALVQHCEKLKDRVALIEPPRQDAEVARVLDWRTQFDTTYAALYHPWVKVNDPLQLDGLLRAVPPSGHVAGVYARSDNQIGVHKPPANELVQGSKDIGVLVDDLGHADLNDNGVNVIRLQSGRGIRIAGARTLSSDTLWRYVNVRRLLIFIEKSIDRSCQWTVFEPNNQDLWREIERVAKHFLDELWLRGMLDGRAAEEAYHVVCDETTNPPEEVDAGRMTCLIGVKPPWPAEFVIVRIGKTEDSTEILESRGGRNG